VTVVVDIIGDDPLEHCFGVQVFVGLERVYEDVVVGCKCRFRQAGLLLLEVDIACEYDVAEDENIGDADVEFELAVVLEGL
jgi:hypothetical protein